ncbi:hypothetical protein [Streptomyces sp. HUAS TT20]|uniref:hypothetical protein n=1 Tax=Streptomyces sp. HUAS TT20 TaxID=3447509 RepID=UPI0021D926FE|nr:hypothetical protein [Streptomyces sp. HUAS 15-9]UXY27783.1 hypothetical protein N8I87_15165 [Streptomyces sp. HUAS 15-9]
MAPSVGHPARDGYVFMRLCTPLSLCLAAAAVLVPLPSAVAWADSAAPCASADNQRFPLTSRIHDGPTTYEAGGGYGTWYIDLTNTTRQTCAAVHPVLVFVDDKRALKASQPKLEFYDGATAHDVRFETTDAHELIGVFDADGFPGFTVGPGKTVSVKVRLSLTSDAVTNAVTANAALVQRHNQDGDWIGQSNDYRFGIGVEPGPIPTPTATPRSATPSGSGTPLPTAEESTPTKEPEQTPVAEESADDGGDGGDGGDEGGGGDRDDIRAGEGAGSRAWELARTGLGAGHGALAGAAVLLVVGGGAYLMARRRR